MSTLRARLEAFRRTHAVRERSVHGVAWRYVIGGAGEDALLLLPGYFVGAESWFAVQERLERSFRVLAVDYAAVETMSELASGLAALLAAEGIEAFHLVGQSVGAVYAQELAARSDAFASTETVESVPRVRSLVLVNGSLPRTADLARVRRGVAVGRLAPAFLHRRQWAHRIAVARPGGDPASTFWRELFVERARRLSKHDAVAWGACYADLLARGELRRADFEPLRGRVMLIESSADPVVGPTERNALRSFHSGSESIVLEGVGHLASEQNPDRLSATIEAFACMCSH